MVASEGKKAVESAPELLRTSQWLRGMLCPVTHTLTFRNLPPGEYQLAFALRDPASQRAIALPLASQGVDRRYGIGGVRVAAGQATLR